MTKLNKIKEEYELALLKMVYLIKLSEKIKDLKKNIELCDDPDCDCGCKSNIELCSDCDCGCKSNVESCDPDCDCGCKSNIELCDDPDCDCGCKSNVELCDPDCDCGCKSNVELCDPDCDCGCKSNIELCDPDCDCGCKSNVELCDPDCDCGCKSNIELCDPDCDCGCKSNIELCDPDCDCGCKGEQAKTNSDNKKKDELETVTGGSDDGDGIDETEIDKEEVEQQENTYLDMARRIQADFDNYRKRNVEIQKQARYEGLKTAVEQFLPTLDVVNHAIKMEKNEINTKGLKMIANMVENALSNLNITKIQSLGENYDPNLHNVIIAEESDKPSGTIIEVLENGYMFDGKVIKHSLVKISK